MHIRNAILDDLGYLVRASARLSREPAPLGESGLLPADPNACGALWADAIRDHFVVIALDDRDRPQGFIFGWIGRHPFNPIVKTLTEALWYVEPGRLAGFAGLLLMDAFVAWGLEHADFLSFTTRKESQVRALERRGFGSPETTLVRWSESRSSVVA